MADDLAGRLLVATPSLKDPNFDRAVLLVLQHDPSDGAMGLVLNRPTGLPLEDDLASWGELTVPPDELFDGGPVQPEVAIALGWLTPGSEATEGIQPVIERIGVVDLRRRPADFPQLVAVRVFGGYAGWATGQLEAEIAQGAWFAFDADPSDVATTDPDRLWRDVFRRQSDSLRMLSTFPDDPTLN